MAGQYWQVNTLGGYLANPRLSRQLRYSAIPLMKFRQFCKVFTEVGKNKGDKLEFIKISRVATPGGPIDELSKMPETNFNIRKDYIQVTEYGNSIPYTGKLEALSEFDITNPIQKTLRDDMALTLDAAAGAQFKASKIIYTPTSAGYYLTNNGVPGGVADVNLRVSDVKNIIDWFRSMNIPPYDGENYICIASVKALRGIMDDSDWVEAAKYGDPERLFAGEVGRIYQCRFIMETNVLSNSKGANGVLGEAVFFGDDAVAEGIVIPAELRAKIPDDYGRSKGIAWYYLGGFKKIWDYATDGEEHIIYVTSAE
jgi:N4-gp56 family major capsid protein